jgi:hypothetical protein
MAPNLKILSFIIESKIDEILAPPNLCPNLGIQFGSKFAAKFAGTISVQLCGVPAQICKQIWQSPRPPNLGQDLRVIEIGQICG